MQSVFESKPSKEKANLTLAVLTSRVVDGGHSIRFDNKYYRTVNKKGLPVYFCKGMEGLVIQAFDKNLFFCVDEMVYALEEIPDHEHISRNLDFQEPTAAPRVKYIPPMNHPWRKTSFAQFKNKQAHRAQLMTGT